MKIRIGTQCGFTLVEMLVAMVITGLAMTATYSVFSSGLRVRAVIWNRHDRALHERYVVEQLASAVAGATPISHTLRGNARSLELMRRIGADPTPGTAPGPLVRQVTLEALEWGVHLGKRSPGAERTVEIDADVAVDVPVKLRAIRYLDRQGIWNGTWRDDRSLPRAVTLEFGHPDAAGRGAGGTIRWRVDLPGAEVWP